MNTRKQIACRWVTPKTLNTLSHPEDGVRKFFCHYESWFIGVNEIVINFCTGSGDQILEYPGNGPTDDMFD